MSQFFTSGGQNIGVSASASAFPRNIQDWFSLGWTGWMLAVQGTLKSPLHYSSKVLILQCSAFFIVQLSHPHMTTGKTMALTRWIFVVKDLCKDPMTNKAMLWVSKTEDFNTFFSQGYSSTQNNVSMFLSPWSLELQVDSSTISATREAPYKY